MFLIFYFVTDNSVRQKRVYAKMLMFIQQKCYLILDKLDRWRFYKFYIQPFSVIPYAYSLLTSLESVQLKNLIYFPLGSNIEQQLSKAIPIPYLNDLAFIYWYVVINFRPNYMGRK